MLAVPAGSLVAVDYNPIALMFGEVVARAAIVPADLRGSYEAGEDIGWDNTLAIRDDVVPEGTRPDSHGYEFPQVASRSVARDYLNTLVEDGSLSPETAMALLDETVALWEATEGDPGWLATGADHEDDTFGSRFADALDASGFNSAHVRALL